MRATGSMLVVAILVGHAAAADQPGLVVAGSEPQAAAPAGTLTVAAGRFVPLTVAGGKPALILGNEAGLLELFTLPAGHSLIGVRYDEPAGAKPKQYTFPAGAATIALAGDVGGSVTLQAVVNGAGTGPPTVAGKLVLTLTAPMPPPGPIPPGPGPGPGPGPNPPTPAPIPDSGFRVLIVYETAALAKMPAEQRNTLYSLAPDSPRTFIETRTVKGIDGVSPERRIWDKDTNAAAETALWQAAFARTKGKPLPWLIVSNGRTGYEGPLPATMKETLDILKKHAE